MLDAGDLDAATALTVEIREEAKGWEPKAGDFVRRWWVEQYRRKLGDEPAKATERVWSEQAEPQSEAVAYRAALMKRLAEKAPAITEALDAAEGKLPAEPKLPDEAELDEAEPDAKPDAEPEPAFIALPGIAGELQEYYLQTAMQPSEIMSVAVGMMVPTVLVSANVTGPSGPDGCALQQTMVGLAPTSGGKQRVIDVSKVSVSKAGAKRLLGPNRFKSGAALVRFVKGNPVSLSIQDEFGSLLRKLGDPKANPCEKEINDRMREMWALALLASTTVLPVQERRTIA